MAETEPFLQMRRMTKVFPGALANDRVDLEIGRGEIHALVGENGAGKSTLMKILYGLHQPDEGTIRLRGVPVHVDSPRRAVSLGIGMVHQHFMLVSRFSVAENVILGHELARWGILSRRRAEGRVADLCREYGFDLPPGEPVGGLSVGEQQRVEILKVLYRGAELLILDEPTAVLVPQEVEELFVSLRRLQAQGKTIVFISHKLKEVLEIADRITVLRRGRVVGTVDGRETTQEDLAEMMAGRPVLFQLDRGPYRPGDPALEVRDLSVTGGQDRARVQGVSLTVRQGEIYGIAGVEGNGQAELVEALIGLQPAAGGSVLIAGRDVTGRSVRSIRLQGVGFIPADRQRRGLVLPMTVRDNTLLGYQRRRRFRRGPLVDFQVVGRHAGELVERFSIRVSSLFTAVLALSGGNQQKVIVARELSQDPQVLIAAQPTRGLDVGAAEFVREQLIAARDQGRAVLLVSADLEEVLSLSDRLGVMYGGRIVAELDPGVATPEELGLYMTGVKGGTDTEDAGREAG